MLSSSLQRLCPKSLGISCKKMMVLFLLSWYISDRCIVLLLIYLMKFWKELSIVIWFIEISSIIYGLESVVISKVSCTICPTGIRILFKTTVSNLGLMYRFAWICQKQQQPLIFQVQWKFFCLESVTIPRASLKPAPIAHHSHISFSESWGNHVTVLFSLLAILKWFLSRHHGGLYLYLPWFTMGKFMWHSLLLSTSNKHPSHPVHFTLKRYPPAASFLVEWLNFLYLPSLT